MPTSLLSNRTIQHVRKLQKDLFQTGLNMADPAITITFLRYNLVTEDYDEIAPQRVMVRFRHDKKLIRVYGGLKTAMASSPTELDGMFMAFDPFDVATGDKFTFQGLSGRIIHTWPPRNGKRRASFTVDSDARAV